MAERNYKRKYLRAPHRFRVIHNSPSGVVISDSYYISEGALLLKNVSSFYEGKELNGLIIPIGQYPIFRDFDLDKIKNFLRSDIPKKVIKVKGKLSRKSQSNFAIEFTDISEENKKLITEYVEIYAANCIYILSMMDMADSDESIAANVRTMTKILGYSETDSLSALKTQVTHDYNSLQWL